MWCWLAPTRNVVESASLRHSECRGVCMMVMSPFNNMHLRNLFSHPSPTFEAICPKILLSSFQNCAGFQCSGDIESETTACQTRKCLLRRTQFQIQIRSDFNSLLWLSRCQIRRPQMEPHLRLVNWLYSTKWRIQLGAGRFYGLEAEFTPTIWSLRWKNLRLKFAPPS